jgi:hypothetical protein
MLRYIAPVLLLGALLLSYPAEVSGQMASRQAQVPGLVGVYVNLSSGRQSYVYRSGPGYLFVDENGASAYFISTGPARLDMVSGDWVPTVVTVGWLRDGRALLRFDAIDRWGFWRQGG